MRKTLNCKPVTELELAFDGGENILLRFDLLSVAELQQMEGGLNALFGKSTPEMAAAIIYATGKNTNKDLDLEKARAIVSNMQLLDIIEIINEFSDSMGAEKNEATAELAKKMMAQYITTLK